MQVIMKLLHSPSIIVQISPGSPQSKLGYAQLQNSRDGFHIFWPTTGHTSFLKEAPI